MRFESFYASFSPSLHPVTDRSFAYSQCHSYVLLWPALLFQLPGLFASFFSPIGFLWCSHTSYGITLYFLLPLSVRTAFNQPQAQSQSHMLDEQLYDNLTKCGLDMVKILVEAGGTAEDLLFFIAAIY